MRNDISLILEAYKKVYEAAGETGAVVSPAKDQLTQSQTTTNTNIPASNIQNQQPVKLNLQDAKKLLKNLSDTYIKAKDSANILQKNNVPNALQSFQSEKDKLLPHITAIVNATPLTGTQKNELLKDLDPDIVKITNQAYSQVAWSGKTTTSTTQTDLNKGTPIQTDKKGGAGGAAAIKDEPIDAAPASTPPPSPSEPANTATSDVVAPATPAVGDETVAPAAPATGEEPIKRATLPEAPYYVMTTKGPRLATKETPGAYQINKPSANK